MKEICCKFPKEPDFLKDNKSAMLHWKMRNIEHTRMILINNMFASHDICYTHPRILGVINHHGSISQTELAGHMNISTAAMSCTVKVLEKQGLIKKSTNTEDLRFNNITLTEKGKTMHKETLSAMLNTDEHMLEGFTEDEADLLLSMLDRVQTNLLKLSENQGETNA